MKIEIPDSLVIYVQINNPKAIIVWDFYDAPIEFQKLSTHGGDEDWIAFIPNEAHQDPSWSWEGGQFGCCSVSEHKVSNGKIRIGAHA